jgi:hypothetical protein
MLDQAAFRLLMKCISDGSFVIIELLSQFVNAEDTGKARPLYDELDPVQGLPPFKKFLVIVAYEVNRRCSSSGSPIAALSHAFPHGWA